MMAQQQEPTEVMRGDAGIARTQLLVLLLLVLVGAAAYLYLFTDIIRPLPESGQQAAPVEQIKQPMPQRPEAAGQQTATSATGAPPTPASAQPAVAPAAPKTSATAAAPSVKPTGATAVPATKAPDAAPASKAAQKTPPAQVQAKKEVPPQKAAAAPATAQDAKVAPPPTGAGKKPAEPKRAVVGKHLLVVGEYASEAEMGTPKAKVVKAGLKPAQEKLAGRTVPMHRLLVGQFGDRSGADAAVQRVKSSGSSAFVMREGDQFAVYAGSFHEAGRAAKEKEKLAAGGIITTMRTTPVSMASYRLTAGRFATMEEARKAAAKLAKAGLSPRVVTPGEK